MADLKVLFFQNQLCARAWRAARTLADHGVSVSLAELKCPPSGKDYSIFETVHKIDVGHDIRSMVEGRKRIASGIKAFVKDGNYSLIHSHNSPDNLGALSIKHLDIPVVHDIHDVMSMTEIRFSSGLKKMAIRHLYNKWEKKVCREAHGLVVPNPYIESLIKKKYGRNDNIYVVGNKPVRMTVDRRKKIRETRKDEINLVWAGAMSFGRGGPRDVIPLLADFAKGNVHVHVYAVTFDQESRDGIRENCAGNDNLHLHDPVPHSELIGELTRYDFGLHIYRMDRGGLFGYGSPTKIYEYAAAGIPTITNSIGYIADLVKKNGFGILIGGSRTHLEPEEIPDPYDLDIPESKIYLLGDEIVHIYRDVLRSGKN